MSEGRASVLSSGPRYVRPRPGVHFYGVSDVDKERRLDDQTRLERHRLGGARDPIPPDPGFRRPVTSNWTDADNSTPIGMSS